MRGRTRASWRVVSQEGEELLRAGKLRVRGATLHERYQGGLRGESWVQVMTVGGKKFAYLEYFRVALGGRSGTFLAQGTGVVTQGGAEGSWETMAGFGTGQLKGFKGRATWIEGEDSGELVLDYSFRPTKRSTG